MRYEKDEYGCYPLSMEEYDAVRQMMGAINVLDNNDVLKQRFDLIDENMWEQYKSCQSKLVELIERLFGSIPPKKLLSMRRELDHTVCITKIRPPSLNEPKDYLYISRTAFERMIQRAIDLNCLICDKSCSEGKRCDLYKDIVDMFPYELTDSDKDEKCPFAGVSKIKGEV